MTAALIAMLVTVLAWAVGAGITLLMVTRHPVPGLESEPDSSWDDDDDEPEGFWPTVLLLLATWPFMLGSWFYERHAAVSDWEEPC